MVLESGLLSEKVRDFLGNLVGICEKINNVEKWITL